MYVNYSPPCHGTEYFQPLCVALQLGHETRFRQKCG